MTSGQRQCEHTKADVSRCQVQALTGSQYCFFHDPAKAKQRTAARRAGGRKRAARAVVLRPDTPDLELRTMQDVAVCLAKTINQVRRGELDVRISNAIGYLWSVLQKALEQSENEKRLEALEAAEAARPKKSVRYAA